jgi:bacteriorhodopsin
MALQPLFPAEENNEVSWYTSGLAGIASGGIKVVEGAFYVWVMFALSDMNKMTPRRYIDWTNTTPIMLLSTIIYFKYSEYKEKGQ